jgi:hypothetical protein
MSILLITRSRLRLHATSTTHRTKVLSASPPRLFFHFSSEHVIDNLQGVGISLGNNVDQIASSVERIKEVEMQRHLEASKKDAISEVFDREEREELEREEVDKLILNFVFRDYGWGDGLV